jgi:hypothetical protein
MQHEIQVQSLPINHFDKLDLKSGYEDLQELNISEERFEFVSNIKTQNN